MFGCLDVCRFSWDSVLMCIMGLRMCPCLGVNECMCVNVYVCMCVYVCL